MSSLSSILEQFKSPPVGPVPTASEWAAFESVVGRQMPVDFRQIIEQTGGANCGRCHPRNPAEKDNIYIALSEAALKREHILWNEIVETMMGVTLFPEPGGLIQLASIDNLSFMLNYTGDNVIICDRAAWETFDTGMIYSDLLWTVFSERKLFDGLGGYIWGRSKKFWAADR